MTRITVGENDKVFVLTGAGIISVALLMAYLFIRPTQIIASNAEETAEEMVSLAMVE